MKRVSGLCLALVLALNIVYSEQCAADESPTEPLNDINQRLIAEEWPDEEKRAAFFDRLGQYVDRSRNEQSFYSELLTDRIELGR